MEQAADKETCSMEYKKGWEEEEYIFCTFREVGPGMQKWKVASEPEW